MARMRSPAVLGVAAVVVLSVGAPRAQAHPSLDWIGLELSPIALNAGSPTANSGIKTSPPRYSVAPGLTLRVGQHRWPSFYWTPGQATFAFGARNAPGAPIVLAAVQTEIGLILPAGEHDVFEAGLAAGVGGLGIEVAYDCDGTCTIGGFGVMAAPVLRLAHRWEGRAVKSAGVFARAAVPLQTKNFLGYNSGWGALFLLGVDLAFGLPVR
jgi:hypothetical protein